MSMKPRRYAEGTTVDAAKSRGEIDGYLGKRGASAFAFHIDQSVFAIQFSIRSRTVRFTVERPKGGTPAKREAEERRLWRALLLVLKGKFEAIDSGITTFDREFLAQLVTSSGVTVGDAIAPKLEAGLAADGAPLVLALPAGSS